MLIVIAPTRETNAVTMRKNVNSRIIIYHCFLSFKNPTIIAPLSAVINCNIPNAVKNIRGTSPSTNKIVTLTKRKMVFAIEAKVIERK